MDKLPFDPLDTPVLAYILAITLGAWGGFVSYILRWRAKRRRAWDALDLLSELIVSAFAAVLVFTGIITWANDLFGLTGAVAASGAAGHYSTRVLGLLWGLITREIALRTGVDWRPKRRRDDE